MFAGAAKATAKIESSLSTDLSPECLSLLETLCVALCCSVLQCVAVCCSVLQCVAVCCTSDNCCRITAVFVSC